MKLAVIGTGQMGQALVYAIIKQGVIAPEKITLYDPALDKAQSLAQELGCKASLTGHEAVNTADAILFAVKPQVMRFVVEDLSDDIRKEALIISIAAGVTLAQLRAWSGPSVAIARVMPNMPAMVASGVSAVCFDLVSEDMQTWTTKLLEASGLVFKVNESAMDAVTGLSGSGPAYVMLVIEAMADGGVRMGLPRDMALQMAAQTVLGSAKLVLETGKHPGVLKDQICSPAGTTIEAVYELEAGGLRAALINAVSVATERSRELAKGSKS
ncbi:MAG: pyrroline-5-carboxylate reductase [Eubacteriales bacterium]|nr:pyrroline-5-carboxylate reductase [Eubacteriales bacterium]